MNSVHWGHTCFCADERSRCGDSKSRIVNMSTPMNEATKQQFVEVCRRRGQDPQQVVRNMIEGYVHKMTTEA